VKDLQEKTVTKREEIRDYPTLKIPFMKSEARIK
jgi:hypothetical protein